MVKTLPAMQETQVQSLGQEDPPEKGVATHSRILSWRIPWAEEPGGLYNIAHGAAESDTTEPLTLSLCLSLQRPVWRNLESRMLFLTAEALLI